MTCDKSRYDTTGYDTNGHDTTGYDPETSGSVPGSDYHPNSIEATFASTRCQHRTPSGRRCRSLISGPSSAFCYTHTLPLQKQAEADNLAAHLTGNLTTFECAYDINQVLSKLFILLSQDRVSPRRAAVLAYIGNLLLRTLPAIEHENSNDEIPRIVFGPPASTTEPQ